MTEDILAFIIEAFFTIFFWLPIWLSLTLLALWWRNITNRWLFAVMGVFSLGVMHVLFITLYNRIILPAWLSVLSNSSAFSCKPHGMCLTVDLFIQGLPLLLALAAYFVLVLTYIMLLLRYRPRWAGLGGPRQHV